MASSVGSCNQCHKEISELKDFIKRWFNLLNRRFDDQDKNFSDQNKKLNEIQSYVCQQFDIPEKSMFQSSTIMECVDDDDDDNVVESANDERFLTRINNSSENFLPSATNREQQKQVRRLDETKPTLSTYQRRNAADVDEVEDDVKVMAHFRTPVVANGSSAAIDYYSDDDPTGHGNTIPVFSGENANESPFYQNALDNSGDHDVLLNNQDKLSDASLDECFDEPSQLANPYTSFVARTLFQNNVGMQHDRNVASSHASPSRSIMSPNQSASFRSVSRSMHNAVASSNHKKSLQESLKRLSAAKRKVVAKKPTLLKSGIEKKSPNLLSLAHSFPSTSRSSSQSLAESANNNTTNSMDHTPTFSECYEYWGDLFVDHEQTLVKFLLKRGSSFTFRYITKTKAIPSISGRYLCTMAEAFCMKMEEYGFGEIERKSSLSNCIFHKRKYAEMSADGKSRFAQLGVDKYAYEKSFLSGVCFGR